MALLAAAVALALVALVVISVSRSVSGSRVGVAASGGGRVTPFTLRSLGGQPISVPVAGRAGVLFFSTSTCASCLPAAKALSAVKARLGSRVDALMVDVDARDRPADLRAWASVVGHPSYPLAIDTSGRLAGVYEIEGLGTTIIYDPRGRIVLRQADPSIAEIEGGLRKAGLSV